MADWRCQLSQSSSLRPRDFRVAFQIVHECREQWADAAAWQSHFVVGTTRLTGMAVAHYGEFSFSAADRAVTTSLRAHVGWRDASARRFFEAAADFYPNAFNFFPGSERLLPRLFAGKQIAAVRSDICRQHDWYRSAVFNEYRRPASVDDNALSAIRRSDGTISFLDVSQDVADLQRTTGRTKRQLALLHRLIAPLVGTELATVAQQGLHGLSPQLRVTLARILSGDTEKTIAVRLRLSRATVHEYVGKIYRHFGVRSRAELMAYFIARQPKLR